MLVNAAKCQGTAFTVSELLRENQLGRGRGKFYPTSRFGLKNFWAALDSIW